MSINRTTANFNLRVPNYDEPQWHVPIDDNWDILDATLGLFVRVSNIRGPWKNATAYVVGDRVVDTVTGLLYETQTAHTSASTGTFAEARAAGPTLWSRIDQFDTDPSAPSFTIEESDDQVPAVNGSIVNALDSDLFGPTNAGWIGKGLYTRRTNETQAQYEARIADPDNVAEATVYRYIGPEGFRVCQQRTTGFTLTQSNAGHLIIINAAAPQNVTFPVGVLRDDQKSHVSDIYPHIWGDLYINPASQNVTIVPGSGVTVVWSNGQASNVMPKGILVRWVYLYLANGSVSLYMNVGKALNAAELPFSGLDVSISSTNTSDAIKELKVALDSLVLGGLANVVGLPITVGDGATISDATHGILYPNSDDLEIKTVVLLNATSGANPMTVTISDDLTLPVQFVAADTQTGVITFQRQTTGTINGNTSETMTGARKRADLTVVAAGKFNLYGDLNKNRALSGNLSVNGNFITGNLREVITRGAASTQPTSADSGAWIVTDGAITIPNVVGFSCMLEFGGDHDVTHNSLTWDTGASAGDIVSVQVKSGNAIRISPIVAAANVITETDFA